MSRSGPAAGRAPRAWKGRRRNDCRGGRWRCIGGINRSIRPDPAHGETFVRSPPIVSEIEIMLDQQRSDVGIVSNPVAPDPGFTKGSVRTKRSNRSGNTDEAGGLREGFAPRYGSREFGWARKTGTIESIHRSRRRAHARLRGCLMLGDPRRLGHQTVSQDAP